MKVTYQQTARQIIIAFTVLLSLGCAPATALSDCDHDHPKKEAPLTMPDFGFSLSGTCNEAPPEAAPAKETEQEDELLKDIEEPPEEPSSDLAATLEEKQQTS